MIVPSEQKVKCDTYGCKNMADFTFKSQKMFGSSSHYCKACLGQMYAEMGKQLVPKSIKTPFKNKKQK